jgi:hypothetical protein
MERKYKAVAVREETATGIGIVRYLPEPSFKGGKTLEIYSIYYPDKLTNKQTFISVCQAINETEPYLLRTALMRTRPNWAALYPQAIVQSESFRIGAHGEALDLAKDAIRRKSSIHENLEGEGNAGGGQSGQRGDGK